MQTSGQHGGTRYLQDRLAATVLLADAVITLGAATAYPAILAFAWPTLPMAVVTWRGLRHERLVAWRRFCFAWIYLISGIPVVFITLAAILAALGQTGGFSPVTWVLGLHLCVYAFAAGRQLRMVGELGGLTSDVAKELARGVAETAVDAIVSPGLVVALAALLGACGAIAGAVGH